MCRKTEADLCCIYVFMMFHFYIGIYHKKIYLFFLSVELYGLDCECESTVGVCVCVCDGFTSGP